MNRRTRQKRLITRSRRRTNIGPRMTIIFERMLVRDYEALADSRKRLKKNFSRFYRISVNEMQVHIDVWDGYGKR